MSTAFYNEENMYQNNIIHPSNYSEENNIVTLKFEYGEIELVVGVNKYVLLSGENNYIKFDKSTNTIVRTSNTLFFKTPNAVIVEYIPSQIANFKGVFDLIKNFSYNPYIKLEKETDILVEQIMDFHKDNLVNAHLDNYNEEELQKISLIL